MEAIRILVVEDDPDINQLLCTIMSDASYQCQPAFSGSEAMLWAERERFDLVLLDLMLPGLTGEEFITRIRRGRTMPIIVLSAKAGLEDRVNVLRLGADDFITKPYNTQILLARIAAILKRSYHNEVSRVLEHKGVSLDLSKSTVSFEGKQAELTKNELRILHLLMENKGNIISRDDIMNDLWQSDEFVDDNTLTVNINRLRKKLEEVGVVNYLVTKRGQGYLV